MPIVNGEKFAYTPEGKRAAVKARKRKTAAPTAPEPIMKSSLMSKGYNFTRNLGVDDTPKIGY